MTLQGRLALRSVQSRSPLAEDREAAEVNDLAVWSRW